MVRQLLGAKQGSCSPGMVGAAPQVLFVKDTSSFGAYNLMSALARGVAGIVTTPSAAADTASPSRLPAVISLELMSMVKLQATLSPAGTRKLAVVTTSGHVNVADEPPAVTTRLA